MKKNTNLIKPGFSIAELLIAVTISMVIAVALVPVIGMKKTKVPLNNFNHGIAECYYDANGELQYYYAISNKSSTPIDTARGQFGGRERSDFIADGACTFDAPKTHYFEVIAIGAGGDGNTGGSFSFDQPVGNALTIEGTIHLDEHYQDDIDNAEAECRRQLTGNLAHGNNCYNFSQRIRNTIRQWSRTSPEQMVASFDVESPLGNSGDTSCVAVITNPSATNCNDFGLGQNFNPESKEFLECRGPWLDEHDWDYVDVPGSTSGTGKKTKNAILVPINDRSQISITRNRKRAGFEVLNASDDNLWKLYINSSRDGVTGSYEYQDASGTGEANTPDIINDENYKNFSANMGESDRSDNLSAISLINTTQTNSPEHGTRGDETDRNCKPIHNFGQDGRVETRDLQWRLQPQALYANSFPRGNYGEPRSMIYENLTGRLTLSPSSNVETDSFVRYTDKDGNTRTLISAGTENSHSGNQQEQVLQITHDDLPILPSLLNFAKGNNRERFTEYLNKIFNSPFKGGLFANDCNNENTSNCPGFAGASTYPYITDLNESSTLTLLNTVTNRSYTHLKTDEAGNEIDFNNNKLCNDGATEPEGSGSILFCRERTQGNRGAIIILW